MPTNPYQPPQEPDADGKVRFYRVRHDAKFWLWTIALATVVAPLGAALGLVVLVAVAGSIFFFEIPLPFSLAAIKPRMFDRLLVGWIIGSILISECIVLYWVLNRSNRIRAMNHRAASKSPNKSIP
jgi:hypothetical protein